MKQQTIENMCANKIKVMRSISSYHPRDEQLCLNCDGYNERCGHYLPYKHNCQIPIRQGIVCLQLYKYGKDGKDRD